MDGFPDMGTKESPPYVPLSFSEPRELFGKPIPQREWIVEDWLPVGVVSLDYGDGGTGKTLLAQQLMTCTALGLPWCGLQPMQCRSLALFCEDDEDELHRRQHAINGFYGTNFGELEGMTWASGAGQDNVLIRFDADGTPILTDRFTDLRQQALDFGARLVVVDTAADTFGGNENDRGQVRQFIGTALTRLARDIRGSVLVNAHPSRSGMREGGTMDSGSTGWSNSARSRWALTRPEAVEGEQPDPDERILTLRKANHARIGHMIRLRWRDGVLAPEIAIANPFAVAGRRAEIETTFLLLLDRANTQDRPMSASAKAGNFAPRVFGISPDRKGITRREFEVAMEALLATNQIAIVAYGSPSRNLTKLVRKGANDAPDLSPPQPEGEQPPYSVYSVVP